jgi:hypothetical protein
MTQTTILLSIKFVHLTERRSTLAVLLLVVSLWAGFLTSAFGAETGTNPSATITNGAESAATNSALTNDAKATGTTTPGKTNAPPASSHEATMINCPWVCVLALLYFVFGTVAVFLYVRREMKEPAFRDAPGAGRDDMQNVRRSNLFFLPVFHIALSAVLLYFCCPPLGTVLMHAVTWFSLGTLLGLIFSVPKSSAQGAPRPEPAVTPATSDKPTLASQNDRKRRSLYETNNNLVEVSDWLTKIIVGLGLIHLKDAPAILRKVVNPLQHCLGDCYLAFGTALVLGFGALGFLFGYVFTRLFLARAFSDADPAEEIAQAEQRLQQRTDEAKASMIKAGSALEQGKVGDAGGHIVAPTDWTERFLKLAEEYGQDQFPSIFQRVSHKDRKADEMVVVLAGTAVSKKAVADLIAQQSGEATSKFCDGMIAGLASYVLLKPETNDLEVLLSVALAARRLHTRYRLLMAFRELLQRGNGTREQFEQVRVLIQGWMADADADLRTAIVALEQLIERRYSPPA